MDIYTYALFSFSLTAGISLGVLGLILLINKCISRIQNN